MMGMSRAGAFNAVSTTMLLMIMLSAGLYFVALNPNLAGFDVQASGSRPVNFASIQSTAYVAPETHYIDNTSSASTSTSSKPDCQSWHKSRKGDTQWGLAQQYSKQSDKWPWIKGMRWVSGKGAKDESLKAGETVCVAW